MNPELAGHAQHRHKLGNYEGQCPSILPRGERMDPREAAPSTQSSIDQLVGDPQQPGRLKRDYASGDNIYLNDAGCAAMASAVDLSKL